jgi:hypothetical protein
MGQQWCHEWIRETFEQLRVMQREKRPGAERQKQSWHEIESGEERSFSYSP